MTIAIVTNMQFMDQNGKHFTGREVWTKVPSTACDGTFSYGWTPEFEGDDTCDLPLTDLVARWQELRGIFDEDIAMERSAIWDRLYELWLAEELDETTLPKELIEDFEGVRTYDEWHDDWSQNMPCDTYGPTGCSTACPRYWECNK